MAPLTHTAVMGGREDCFSRSLLTAPLSPHLSPLAASQNAVKAKETGVVALSIQQRLFVAKDECTCSDAVAPRARHAALLHQCSRTPFTAALSFFLCRLCFLLTPQNNNSLFCLTPSNPVRRFCHRIAFDRRFDAFVLLLIIISSALLAAENPTDPDAQINKDLVKADIFFTSVFAQGQRDLR